MKRIRFLILLILLSDCLNSQKISVNVNLTTPFSGLSYTNGHNMDEFRPSIARINFSWRIGFMYKPRKTSHNISIEQLPFEKYFKIINKFLHQPGNQDLLGFSEASFGTAIDHLIFSYFLQKDGNNTKGFLFNSKIRFNFSAGLGVSFNRSKSYYNELYSHSSGGYSSSRTYYGYEAIHYRDGIGIFLRGAGGFNFENKKGISFLNLNVFMFQGIRDMAHYDIHYRYGYWNDASKQVDVSGQILRSRGTSFGISLGKTITIKK